MKTFAYEMVLTFREWKMESPFWYTSISERMYTKDESVHLLCTCDQKRKLQNGARVLEMRNDSSIFSSGFNPLEKMEVSFLTIFYMPSDKLSDGM